MITFVSCQAKVESDADSLEQGVTDCMLTVLSQQKGDTWMPLADQRTIDRLVIIPSTICFTLKAWNFL